MSGTEGREMNMRTSHRSLSMVSGELKLTCPTRLCARSKNNKELNCFRVLGSSCCDMRDREDIFWIQHRICVSRQCHWCLGMMEDIWLWICLKARTMWNICIGGITKGVLMNSIVLSGNNITIGDRLLTATQSKEGLWEKGIIKVALLDRGPTDCSEVLIN